jgi:NADH dehydrogenase
MLEHIDIPPTHKKRLVIIGGGFAGMNLAKKIDSKIFQTVLFDKNNYHTFQPLLYQVAGAGLEPESVCSPLRKILKNIKDIHFRMLKVDRVDLDKKVVFTARGTLEYDYLVVASGAKTNFFGNANFKATTLPLKELTDSIALRNHILMSLEASLLEKDPMKRKALRTFVIVGGGPTGVELAGALAELSHHVLPKDYPGIDMKEVTVYLIEGLSRLLSAMSEKAGLHADRDLTRLGVTVMLNTKLNRYDGENLYLEDGTSIAAGTVVWAAGVEAATIDGFPEASMNRKRLNVNDFNQVLMPDGGGCMDSVFALGDCAYMPSPKFERGLPAIAPAAIQQGRFLAKNLFLKESGKPMKPFFYKDKGTMATIGRNLAVADMKNRTVSGFWGWILWMVIHLWFLIGFRNKAVVLVNWMWSYLTYDRGLRIIVPQEVRLIQCQDRGCLVKKNPMAALYSSKPKT